MGRLAAVSIALAGLVALLVPAASGGAGPPGCPTSQLRLTVLDMQGATSHSYWDLALRNVGRRSCRLQGYPGVGLIDAQRNPIADAVQREPGLPTPSVTVKPGRKAYFTFGYVVAGPCLPDAFQAHGIEVYPPDQRERLVLLSHGAMEVCDRSVGGPPVVYPIRAAPQVG